MIATATMTTAATATIERTHTRSDSTNNTGIHNIANSSDNGPPSRGTGGESHYIHNGSYGATSSNKHWNSGRTQTSYKPLQGRPYVHQLPQQRGKQRHLQRRRGRSGLSMLQLLFSTAICMDFRSISSYLSKRTLRYSYIPEASALFRCIYVKRPPQHAAGSPGPKSGRVDYNIIGNATTSLSDFT